MFQGQSFFERRLKRLQQDDARRAAYEVDGSWYEFRVAPTCPPTTAIQVRGGLAYAEKTDGGEAWTSRAWTVPDLHRDLADPDDLVATDTTFTDFDAYRYFVVLLAIPEQVEQPDPSDWLIRLKCWNEEHAADEGFTLEVATAGEAEAALWAFMQHGGTDDYAWPWADFDPPTGMPLCGVILRGDGLGGFRDIDLVNRGRSYLWPRDLRPRWMAA